MFKLATTPRPEPHKFPRAVVVRTGRHEQHERACPNCTLVRITVITSGGEVRREYRWGKGPQFEMSCEPACNAKG